MEPNNHPLLVCLEADAGFSIAGAVFHHRCAQCGRRVMVAPSGVAYLHRNLGAVICCRPCFLKFQAPSASTVKLAGPPEEIARELGQVIPNPWNKRN